MTSTEYRQPGQDEIVARINGIDDREDMLGFRREVLLEALDFDHAKPWLKDHVTAADWRPVTDIAEAAQGYLTFALGKIADHRGISAERSVNKLAEYAWLLGRDDVVAAMDAADYPQYGAPKVKAFAVGMGWPWPSDDAELERMAHGNPCTDDCEDGCGL